MGRAYSQDLRERVMAAVDSGTGAYAAAAFSRGTRCRPSSRAPRRAKLAVRQASYHSLMSRAQTTSSCAASFGLGPPAQGRALASPVLFRRPRALETRALET